jgi:hypothetical protein
VGLGSFRSYSTKRNSIAEWNTTFSKGWTRKKERRDRQTTRMCIRGESKKKRRSGEWQKDSVNTDWHTLHYVEGWVSLRPRAVFPLSTLFESFLTQSCLLQSPPLRAYFTFNSSTSLFPLEPSMCKLKSYLTLLLLCFPFEPSMCKMKYGFRRNLMPLMGESGFEDKN